MPIIVIFKSRELLKGAVRNPHSAGLMETSGIIGVLAKGFSTSKHIQVEVTKNAVIGIIMPTAVGCSLNRTTDKRMKSILSLQPQQPLQTLHKSTNGTTDKSNNDHG